MKLIPIIGQIKRRLENECAVGTESGEDGLATRLPLHSLSAEREANRPPERAVRREPNSAAVGRSVLSAGLGVPINGDLQNLGVGANNALDQCDEGIINSHLVATEELFFQRTILVHLDNPVNARS